MDSPRLVLSLAFCVLVPGLASAQLRTSKPQPITTQVKEAGVYHLATGTWTRGARPAALAGPEVIYDNTCTVGYYFGMSLLDTVYSSGRIPSLNSPTQPGSLPGLGDLYEVNGFTIGYCSFVPFRTKADVTFVDCYSACSSFTGLPTPLVTFNLTNLPAGPAAGGMGCWVVTLDLTNTTESFALVGDCNATYNNVASTDSFGWGWREIATGSSSGGPLFAGDPAGFFPQSGQVCGGVGSGTTFVGATPGPGTGIGIIDQMQLGGGPTYPGCFWFGGYGGVNPFTEFYMQLQGTVIDVSDCAGSAYCFGDGSGAACPCGNTGPAGAGCANSSGSGATLSGSGCGSFSLDTLSLSVTGVNGAKPGLLLRGNNQVNGGLGNPVGDGLVCAGGGSQRSQIQVSDASGSTTFNDWNGAGFGSVANVGAPVNFQYWYRDPMGSPCATDFNFSNAWTVMYMP